ncbi:hypothetical protein O6H91_19G033700 [Diphasiastrum complanatum]|uniref:Uncharacterized protein n=1 Tax=Diphasiastrum complanatum TaxID=34168 RepID=A0ACC2ATY1_DIPCM|nr:hypothetical protein O6H91_19G033700 [Diphasiastrum complanatum]
MAYACQMQSSFHSFQTQLWDVELTAEAVTSPLVLDEFIKTGEYSDSDCRLPEQYILPEQLCPQVAYNSYTEGTPVIDLKSFTMSDDQSTLQNSIEEVAKALKEWRIFHVINHGVRKEKLPWSEAFTVMGSPELHVREYASKIWPHDHDTFSCACEEYGSCFRQLAEQIMNILINVLEVDPGHFEELRKRPLVALHPNHYPICPEPDKTLGLGPHTDPGFFTLLLLDENVGGLQIEKDGKWIAIRPLKDAITYITGDCIEVTSQGRYKAVRHRAVTNSKQPRSSISFMYAPTPTATISCPPELITEEQPQIYRPFTWDDILAIRKSRATEIHQGKLRIIDTFMKI